MIKKTKLTSILWATLYFGIVCSIITSACILFHNNYFALIYVEGSSMTPTLNKNGITEFGIVDEHKTAIDSIKRFDIITTYYPIKYNSSFGYISDYVYINDQGKEVYTSYDDTEHKVQVSKNADYKIKRVIALPGESFRVQTNGVEVRSRTEDNSWGEITFYRFPFEHTHGYKEDDAFRNLESDEYWVLGDNWGGSIDSKAIDKPIRKGNIQGKLIAIEGTCKVKTQNGKVVLQNKKYYSSFRFF